jgi:polyketide cyclase/dehydrase/lipid transport protein
MGQQPPTAQISLLCKARPEAVYDVLADLRTHLEWGGARQRRDFRLLSLDASREPATVGTAFSSTGAIPMSTRRWEDRSTVTVADRPRTFEFTTEGKAGEHRAMSARYRHRYEISPEAGGSRVTYTLTQVTISNPMLRLALPGIRQLTWRMAIPMLASRGLRNLSALAEERVAPIEASRASSTIAGGSMHTEEM